MYEIINIPTNITPEEFWVIYNSLYQKEEKKEITYPSNRKSKGRRIYTKEEISEYRKKYYEKHKEKLKKISNDFYYKNKEKIDEQNNIRNKKRNKEISVIKKQKRLEQTIQKKKKFLIDFDKYNCVRYKTNINNYTFYKWIDEDKEFKKKVNELLFIKKVNKIVENEAKRNKNRKK